MHKASISIFKKAFDYDDSEASPLVSSDVLEAVQRVIKTKGIEIIRRIDGFFVIQYSENGPFREPISDEWLPVYIARIKEWTSGGVKKSEMEAYQSV
jgi:hypothetical protein